MTITSLEENVDEKNKKKRKVNKKPPAAPPAIPLERQTCDSEGTLEFVEIKQIKNEKMNEDKASPKKKPAAKKRVKKMESETPPTEDITVTQTKKTRAPKKAKTTE